MSHTRRHRFSAGFRRVVASLLIASIALGIGITPYAAAAPPATDAPKGASAQPSATAHSATPTTAKPTASHTSAPPTATATRGSASPSPSVSPTATAKPLATPSPTASTTTAAPSTAQTSASATPAAATTSVITRLLVPTNSPTTPPPPPVPTLDLSGLQILDNPGIGGNAVIARIALHHYGEYYRPDGVPWVGWCEMFADNVLTEAGIPRVRYASAILDAISGPLYRGEAPAGSLVFFDQRSSPYGHVGVALGDTTMLSALGGGIVRTSYADWPSYLGWRPYGTTAPDETPVTVHVYSATNPDNPSLDWQTDPTVASDDPSLSWQASALTPDNISLGWGPLAPPVYSGWGIASPLLSPRQTMA